MDVTATDSLTQLRMIHYMVSENAAGTWRAGNHTDVGCLTLLFQRDGEDGLEICPGRESHNDHAIGDVFTPLPAKDTGKSPDRYSIAYFNTGRKGVVMQGPLKK